VKRIVIEIDELDEEVFEDMWDRMLDVVSDYVRADRYSFQVYTGDFA
jgi:hypothetical protein